MTKAEQLRKNGKFRKKSVKDGKYLADLHLMNLTCIVCDCAPIELHHVYSNLHGVERSDHLVIPLCPAHHRGYECSPHGNKGEFKNLFTFEELLYLAEEIRRKYLSQKSFIYN